VLQDEELLMSSLIELSKQILLVDEAQRISVSFQSHRVQKVYKWNLNSEST
jgi:hypothetical protein